MGHSGELHPAPAPVPLPSAERRSVVARRGCPPSAQWRSRRGTSHCVVLGRERGGRAGGSSRSGLASKPP
eukprot:14054513-Heterocapsa_arctica.AAC.1